MSPDPYGGLMVLPKDSIQFSSALVFTRVRGLEELRKRSMGGVSSTLGEREGFKTGRMKWTQFGVG